jgi:hypothetical protein
MGEIKKMLENEKYIEKSTYEYNIMNCTVSCRIFGEPGDRD